MPVAHSHTPRTAVLIGPYQSGKSTLFEALLAEAGTQVAHGDGLTVADTTPEAKAHAMSTELTIASLTYLDESWTVIDCPGSVELLQESRNAISVADIAVVVVEPEVEKSLGLAGYLKMLDEAGVPHIVFINKFDKKNLSLRALLEAFQGASRHPLVLREIPIHDGDTVKGHVDLVSERAFHWEEGKHSTLMKVPESVAEREAQARTEMMESLADFDDGLLEKLLEDVEPSANEVYENMINDLSANLVVPVFFGSAEQGHGIRRLMKALRHEAPNVDVAADRLGVPDDGKTWVKVFKTIHAGHAGKLSLARVMRGTLSSGDIIDGARPSGMNRMFGRKMDPVNSAKAGDVVGLTKLDGIATGDLVSEDSRTAEDGLASPPAPLYALAITADNHADEVKLPENLRKLMDEDPSIVAEFDELTGEQVLRGQGDTQLRLVLERLKDRFGLVVNAATPSVAYRESIRKPVKTRVRHKKQSGGHGEFGEVELEVSPCARGEGFSFSDRIHGGVVPKQYHSAVESGVQDSMVKGPNGFPVVDVSVVLTDGKAHSVDSSEMAFRKAGAQAMREALAQAGPVVLEPVNNVAMLVPDEYISAVQKIITGRRGQIFGLEAKEGWQGWDEVTGQIPAAEMQDLIVELRSVTQGVGTFTASFDRLQEVSVKDIVTVAAQ